MHRPLSPVPFPVTFTRRHSAVRHRVCNRHPRKVLWSDYGRKRAADFRWHGYVDDSTSTPQAATRSLWLLCSPWMAQQQHVIPLKRNCFGKSSVVWNRDQISGSSRSEEKRRRETLHHQLAAALTRYSLATAVTPRYRPYINIIAYWYHLRLSRNHGCDNDKLLRVY
eukprot:SAG31_NODE_1743_length_7383_cov_21.902389_4_plen_167_part_00